MATEKSIPLCLDIKTEYNDEIFEKVLEYLRTLKTRLACFSESNEYDTNKLRFEIRLIAANLLVSKSEGNAIAHKHLSILQSDFNKLNSKLSTI
jgi:hypothetical protein